MSACQDVRRELSALLDRELPPEKSAAVQDHLLSCQACQREWEALQSVDGQLQRLLAIDDVARQVASIQQAAKVQPAAFQSARSLVAVDRDRGGRCCVDRVCGCGHASS